MQHLSSHSMYFLAIVCPPEINEKVLSLKRWMKDQFGCVVALKSPAHITLIPPFWLDDGKELLLLQSLHSFLSDTEELVIGLDGFAHFGKRVLFVAVKEDPALSKLKDQAAFHFIQSLGETIPKDNRPFHPHVTIANRDLKPSAFEKAWQHFYKKHFNETFPAKSISLLKLSLGAWQVTGEKQW